MPADTFSEPENEAMTYSYSFPSSAYWLNVDQTTGTFSGTPPDNAQAGTLQLTVTAADPHAFVADTSETFTLTVKANQPPSLDNPL